MKFLAMLCLALVYGRATLAEPLHRNPGSGRRSRAPSPVRPRGTARPFMEEIPDTHSVVRAK
jgi:hypothetical protein